MMRTAVDVVHLRIDIKSAFDTLSVNLESNLSKLDEKHVKDVMKDPKKLEPYFKSLEGKAGLMIFNIENHGALLHIKDSHRKSKKYVIGNPLAPIQMTIHDIRVSLYAPLIEAPKHKPHYEYRSSKSRITWTLGKYHA